MHYKHKNFFKPLMIGMLIIFVSVFILPVMTAEAKVMVFPRRIIFEDNNRSATIRLINTGEEQITYRILFMQSRMTEDGNIERIASPEQREDRLDQMMAQDLIRYSPRQVTLPPGEIQLVRLQVNKPAGLEEGEYRSRLLFQEIPENIEFEGDDSANNGGFSIELRAIYGISIPIFVRHGELSADVEISDVQLSKNEATDLLPEIFLTINRRGSSSIYGNIEVKYIPNEGRTKILGRISGTALYTDVEERNLRLSLPGAQDIELNEGKIYISYSRPDEDGGGILAETELEL
jgi:P pilus assembly chaperone PapD